MELECTDRYCKTNDPNSKVICKKCLTETINELTIDELYDLYYYIIIKLRNHNGDDKSLSAVEKGVFDLVNRLIIAKEK